MHWFLHTVAISSAFQYTTDHPPRAPPPPHPAPTCPQVCGVCEDMIFHMIGSWQPTNQTRYNQEHETLHFTFILQLRAGQSLPNLRQAQSCFVTVSPVVEYRSEDIQKISTGSHHIDEVLHRNHCTGKCFDSFRHGYGMVLSNGCPNGLSVCLFCLSACLYVWCSSLCQSAHRTVISNY